MKISKFGLSLIASFFLVSCMENNNSEEHISEDVDSEAVVDGGAVVSGLEIFLENHLDWVEDKSVGLITNNTGIDRELNSTVDLMNNHSDINLVALYAPEHGVRGDAKAGDYVESYTDEKTGLPVYSLYGPTWKPSEDMLKDVDVLVFDIQDIGSNVYTYIYTLGFVMESAAEQNKSVIVLDRPNALGGEKVEGPLREEDTVSFMGRYLLPVRHGMTAGELALMWNHEYNLGVDLKVSEMSGWERTMHFEDTGLPWVLTSPNIPTPDSANLYAGTILVANSNLSEGLGTTRPFEFVGAPWIDAEELRNDMENKDLTGVSFRTQYFTPMFGVYEGNLVSGVQVHVEDASEVNVVELGLELATSMRDQNPDRYEIDDNYNELIGSTKARDMLADGEDAQAIIDEWEQELNEWTENVRNNYLLYGPFPQEVEKYEPQPVLGILPHDLNLYPGQEIPVSVHVYDEDGSFVNPNYDEVNWTVPEGIVELNNGELEALEEGQGEMLVEFNGVETSVPVQVSKNIIENIEAVAHDTHTRIVIDLNQTIDFNFNQQSQSIVLEIPQAELSENIEENTLTVEDSPVLEEINFRIVDEEFIAEINMSEANVEVETPEYANRIVLDLVH